MEFIDKLKFSSVCGIYCETECCIYKAYKKDNKSMRRQIAAILFKDPERWPEVRCDGCKGEKAISWDQTCPVRKCAYQNNLEFCIECQQYPCMLLQKRQENNEKETIGKARRRD